MSPGLRRVCGRHGLCQSARIGIRMDMYVSPWAFHEQASQSSLGLNCVVGSAHNASTMREMPG
jgi:hypothetical protein